MTKSEIQHIINKGEGLTIEFKTAKNKLPNNLFETVCAFLNRDGGTILLGVSDNREVVGIDEKLVEPLCKNFTNLSNNGQKLNPAFLLQPKIVDFDGKKLIYVFIPASSQVHKTNGKIYDRSSDGDFIVSANEQISRMYIRKSSYYSESIIYPYLKESHFVDGIVEKAMHLIRNNRPNHPWLALKRMDLYKAAGLYRTDIKSNAEGFTQAALLLFGKEEIIQSAIPHYKIDAVLRRENLNRYDDRENIRCNLIDAYDMLMNFVAKHLSDKFYLDGDRRISLREKIFREIIANLLMHREYSNALPSTFIIYKNKVVVKNANRARLHGVLIPGKFEPFSKNPSIAKFFVQMAFAEDLGTGINNVYRFLKPYADTKPIFKEEDTFIVEIPLLKEVPDKVPDKVPDILTSNQLSIINLIQTNNKISMSQMAEEIGMSKRKILDNINKLREKNIVVRVGNTKTGYWKIFKRQNNE